MRLPPLRLPSLKGKIIPESVLSSLPVVGSIHILWDKFSETWGPGSAVILAAWVMRCPEPSPRTQNMQTLTRLEPFSDGNRMGFRTGQKEGQQLDRPDLWESPILHTALACFCFIRPHL